MKRFKVLLLGSLAAISMLAVLLSAACTSVKAEDIQGLLQAMEGKEMVVTLDDGSTVRITVQDAKAAAQAEKLVGEVVTAKVRGDDKRLVEVKQLGEDEHFAGAIESKGADSWIIGGKTFKVDANTVLDGGLVAGAPARVEFVKMPDGSLKAMHIETDKEDEHLAGQIESISSGSVVIGGKTIKLDAATRRDSGLAAGKAVRVEFVVLPDGSALATEVEVDEAEDRTIGKVESTGDDDWVIGGKRFKVNKATRFDKGLAKGVEARVEFIEMGGGSKVATRIYVDKSGPGKGGMQRVENFSGKVESISANSWVVGGKTFQVNASTKIDGGLAAGAMVKVKAMTMTDASLVAVEIEAEQAEDRVSGKVESVSGDSIVVGGKSVRLDSRTRISGDLSRDVRATVKFEKLPDGSLRALEIETEKAEGKFLGKIESIGSDSWVIGGKTFQVTVATGLDQGLMLGATATVEFVAMPDGSLRATSIETDLRQREAEQERETERESKEGELIGKVERIGPDSWVIGGKTLRVNAATLLDQGLAAGVEARVEFRAQADGSMVAVSIETDQPDEQEVQFVGKVETIGADSWMIGGKKFAVDASTLLDLGLAVGVEARVEFRTMPDGSLVAKHIENDAENVHFAGKVESMGGDAWSIGGKFFRVDANTVLDNGLVVGVDARVEFVTMPDGSVRAIHIETEQEFEQEHGPEVEMEDAKFTGNIETMGAGAWVIGGKSFQVNASTMLDSGLAVGVQATVEFRTLADGSLVATSIETGVSGQSGEAEPGDDRGGGAEPGDDGGPSGSNRGSSGSGSGPSGSGR